MENKDLQEKILVCPLCSSSISVDSVREFTDGRTRIYWECAECNLSMMKR